MSLTERRAKFVYEGAILAAIAANAPIIPESWEQRDEAFRAQFCEVIDRQCGPMRSGSPAELHGGWVQAYIDMGWTYGPVRDPEAKTHPDMVPYDQLGQLEQDKDAVFVALCEIARQWIYDEPMVRAVCGALVSGDNEHPCVLNQGHAGFCDYGGLGDGDLQALPDPTPHGTEPWDRPAGYVPCSICNGQPSDPVHDGGPKDHGGGMMGDERENFPTWHELWERVVKADDMACNGGWQDSDCPWCRHVVELLRGGSVWCEGCGHINAIGHQCADWECDGGHTTCRFVGQSQRQPPGDANYPPPATCNPTRVTFHAA